MENINQNHDSAEAMLADVYDMGDGAELHTLTTTKNDSGEASNSGRVSWWVSPQAATERSQSWYADAQSLILKTTSGIHNAQRRRELANAASYVMAYYREQNRMPTDLGEAGYSDMSRLPIDGPVGRGVVTLTDLNVRTRTPIGFSIAIEDPAGESTLRFSYSGTWGCDFLETK